MTAGLKRSKNLSRTAVRHCPSSSAQCLPSALCSPPSTYPVYSHCSMAIFALSDQKKLPLTLPLSDRPTKKTSPDFFFMWTSHSGKSSFMITNYDLYFSYQQIPLLFYYTLAFIAIPWAKDSGLQTGGQGTENSREYFYIKGKKFQLVKPGAQLFIQTPLSPS